MWIKTQDKRLINTDKVYQFYIDDTEEKTKIYAQVETAEHWDDWTMGTYATTKKSEEILKNIFSALHNEQTTFEMPPEEEFL